MPKKNNLDDFLGFLICIAILIVFVTTALLVVISIIYWYISLPIFGAILVTVFAILHKRRKIYLRKKKISRFIRYREKKMTLAFLIIGIVFYSLSILIQVVGIITNTIYNLSWALIVILFCIIGLSYTVTSFIKKKIHVRELRYWSFIAPIAWIITSNIILFSLGYNYRTPHVVLPIWLITSFIWYIIPIATISFYNWNNNWKINKERKLMEKEVMQDNLTNLLHKSKRLNELGKKSYSKENFEESIILWKDAMHNYENALNLTPTPDQKVKIEDYIKVLAENICYAYIEIGENYNLVAKKAHKKINTTKAESDWKNAINNYQLAIEQIKIQSLDIPFKQVQLKINSIKLNLKQLEIENLCISADKEFELAQTLPNTKLEEAIKNVQDSISKYVQARNKAVSNPEFQDLVDKIQNKLERARNLSTTLHDKMDELLGITPITPKIISDDGVEYNKVETIIKGSEREKALSIIREYEFIGGQIRFKIALINNTNNPLTNFRISFDLPDALKWLYHEPKYERKGDSILIPKLGVKEKKAISLYLEPINCMKSPINATISFYDSKDRPQAVTMNPKMVNITCPIFFTEGDANIARVKNLKQSLNHCDRKIFPVNNSEKTAVIFSSVLTALGNHDIKLVFKEYSEINKLGEAWYYGLTKVKKENIITYVSINGESRNLELEVSGNEESQITAFLAEIGNDIRTQLLEHNIISSKNEFYDITASIQLYQCPYCCSAIPSDLVDSYLQGNSIKCNYCNENLNLKENYN